MNQILESIRAFQAAENLAVKKLRKDITRNFRTIENFTDVYIEHIVYLQQIKYFSTIKYLESCEQKNELPQHLKRKLKVLKKLDQKFLHELTSARFSLFFVWNKNRENDDFECIRSYLANYLKYFTEFTDILKEFLEAKDRYSALILCKNNDFSTEFFEGFFLKIAPITKELYPENKLKNFKATPIELDTLKHGQDKQIVECILELLELKKPTTKLTPVYRPSFMLTPSNVKNNDFCAYITAKVMNYLGQILAQNFEFEIDPANNELKIMQVVYMLVFIVIRSTEFLESFSGQLKRIIRYKSKLCDTSNLHALLNQENEHIFCTDEISYLMYSMMQYVIEKDLINGKLKIDNLPQTWINGIQHYFKRNAKPQDFLCNSQWFEGEFGLPGFNAFALVSGLGMHSTYMKHKTLEKLIDFDIDKDIDNNVNNFKEYLTNKFCTEILK